MAQSLSVSNLFAEPVAEVFLQKAAMQVLCRIIVVVTIK